MQKIGLPVVLSEASEIDAYTQAKRRLEQKYDELEIGAFFFQYPSNLDPASVEQAVENSQDVHVISTQLAYEHGLDIIYDESQEKARTALGQTSALANTAENLALDFHLGVVAHTRDEVLSIQQNYDSIYDELVKAIGNLADTAEEHGLGLTIESSPPLALNDVEGTPTPHYFAFQTLPQIQDLLQDVGKDNIGITLDIAAYSLTRARETLPSKMEELTARINGFNSWDEYMDNYGSYEDWLNAASEFHISNATGIACRVKDEATLERFGKMGTIEGLLTRGEIQKALQTAQEKDLVSNIEIDLNLQELDYREVDRFLDAVL